MEYYFKTQHYSIASQLEITSYLKKNGYPQLGNSFSPYSDDLIPIMLANSGKIIFINQKLVFLRTHENSLSANSTDIKAYTTAQKDFLRLFFIHIKQNNYKKDYYKLKLLIRFIYDDFSIFIRNKKLSPATKLIAYFKIQHKKKQTLNKFNRFKFSLYVIYLPIRIILIKLIRNYLI